jgi:hypothetical protein
MLQITTGTSCIFRFYVSPDDVNPMKQSDLSNSSEHTDAEYAKDWTTPGAGSHEASEYRAKLWTCQHLDLCLNNLCTAI